MSSTPASLYQDSFAASRPTLAHSAVALHLSLSRAYTLDLLAYFHERALVEDAYLKSLSRLSSRLSPAASASDKDKLFTHLDALGISPQKEAEQLGAWKAVKEGLEREVRELVVVHETWKRKVGDEVEGPLRTALGGREWKEYERVEAQFGANVREYEDVLGRVQKAEGKSKPASTSSSKTSKILTLQSTLSTLSSSLQSTLPSLLSTAQRTHGVHSTLLKESLVRYGTLGSDLGRERMEMGERVLVGVLGVDDAVEEEGWAVRESMRSGGRTARAPPPTGEFGTIQEENPSFAAPNGDHRSRPTTAAPPPAPILLPPAVAPSSSSTHTPTKSGFKLPSFLKPSGNRDRSASSASAGAGRNYGNLDVPLPTSDRGSVESDQGRPGMRSTTSFGSSDRGAAGGGKKRESLMPFGGGGGGGGGLFRRGSTVGPPRGGAVLSDEPRGGGRTVDDEGYTVPPKGYDREITAVAGVNLMDEEEDEPDSSMASSALPKVPIPTLAPTTIIESDSSRQAALERVKSTLGPTPLSRRSNSSATARGRRQTTYNLGAIPPLPSGAGVGTGAGAGTDDDTPLAKLVAGQPLVSSPTGTARTSSFLGSGGDPFSDAPFDGPPFLTLVETVNAQFGPSGEILRLAVTGEVALRGTTPGGSLRLLHAEELDKVAPNRAFLAGDGSEGQYEIVPSAPGNGGIVLRYLRRVLPGTEADYVPLKLLRARWKCEAGTTKFFVDYDAAEALTGVVVDVSFDVGVTAVQAKPTAVMEGSKLVWHLGDLTPGEGKVLAALETEGTAQPGAVSFKWRVEGRTHGEVGVEVGGVEEVRRTIVAGRFLVSP